MAKCPYYGKIAYYGEGTVWGARVSQARDASSILVARFFICLKRRDLRGVRLTKYRRLYILLAGV